MFKTFIASVVGSVTQSSNRTVRHARIDDNVFLRFSHNCLLVGINFFYLALYIF